MDMASHLMSATVEIEQALTEGYRVEFRGFGIWEVRMSKERVGRNPQRPENGQLRIPSQPVVRFRVGRDLKNNVRNPKPALAPAPAPKSVVASVVITAHPIALGEYEHEHDQPKM
jgi:nucleoid DNA-binding protein